MGTDLNFSQLVQHQSTDQSNMDAKGSLTLSCNSPVTKQDIVFCVLYSVVVLIGVVGNSMVIAIVCKTRSMHTTTNYLLMNLAVADLLTLLLCPGIYDFALPCVHTPSIANDVICKLFAGNAIVPITINAAVLTVCTIAFERYLALMKPLNTRIRLSEEKVGYAVGVIWFMAFLACIPDILTNTFPDTPSQKYQCTRPWSLQDQASNRAFIITTCVLFGILPSMLVSFCYVQIIRGLYFTRTICSETAMPTQGERQEKKKLARLLVWLSILFAVCSLPFAGFFLFLPSLDDQDIRERYGTLYLVHRIARFFLFANSFLNPILYAFQSSNYRQGFASLCCHMNDNRREQIPMANRNTNRQQDCDATV